MGSSQRSSSNASANLRTIATKQLPVSALRCELDICLQVDTSALSNGKAWLTLKRLVMRKNLCVGDYDDSKIRMVTNEALRPAGALRASAIP